MWATYDIFVNLIFEILTVHLFFTEKYAFWRNIILGRICFIQSGSDPSTFIPNYLHIVIVLSVFVWCVSFNHTPLSRCHIMRAPLIQSCLQSLLFPIMVLLVYNVCFFISILSRIWPMVIPWENWPNLSGKLIYKRYFKHKIYIEYLCTLLCESHIHGIEFSEETAVRKIISSVLTNNRLFEQPQYYGILIMAPFTNTD